MYFMGIDCGTQGTKVVIFDPKTGLIIGKGYTKHQIISDDSGMREQKVNWWTDAMLEAMETALAKANINRMEVKALAVSGQQHGLVVMDENKQVIRDVKLWNDTSTASDNEEIIARRGGSDAVWESIHTTLPVGYTASKIANLIRCEPNIYKQVRYVLLPHDYLNFFLTGSIVTESSEASGTGYYDVKKRSYSAEMLWAIDPSGALGKAIPPIISWETPVGMLKPDIAKALGMSPTTLVAAGGGDNTMSAIGTGSIVEGTCSLSLGTSGTVIINSPHLKDSLDRLIQIYDVLGDKWLATVCTLNATSATNVVQDVFGVSLSEFDVLMAKAPIGAGGVKVLPYFGGERMPPLPHAKGVIKHLTSNNFTRENLVRATAEAVVCTLRWGYDKLLESFKGPTSITINGGGANSAPWRQIVSDLFNLPVHSLQSDEGGAFGAALQAMYLHGYISNHQKSLQSLCDTYIAIDHSKDCFPIQAHVDAYKSVYVSFIHGLQKEWGAEF